MSQDHAQEISKHVKTYVFIFIALAALTLVTVWASHLQVAPTMHIVIALSIASFKGALVALFFMHLSSERRVIYGVLVFTIFFFLALILMTYFSHIGAINSHLSIVH